MISLNPRSQAAAGEQAEHDAWSSGRRVPDGIGRETFGHEPELDTVSQTLAVVDVGQQTTAKPRREARHERMGWSLEETRKTVHKGPFLHAEPADARQWGGPGRLWKVVLASGRRNGAPGRG